MVEHAIVALLETFVAIEQTHRVGLQFHINAILVIPSGTVALAQHLLEVLDEVDGAAH